MCGTTKACLCKSTVIGSAPGTAGTCIYHFSFASNISFGYVSSGISHKSIAFKISSWVAWAGRATSFWLILILGGHIDIVITKPEHKIATDTLHMCVSPYTCTMHIKHTSDVYASDMHSAVQQVTNQCLHWEVHPHTQTCITICLEHQHSYQDQIYISELEQICVQK